MISGEVDDVGLYVISELEGRLGQGPGEVVTPHPSKKQNVYCSVNRKWPSQKSVMSHIENTFPIGGCPFHIDV